MLSACCAPPPEAAAPEEFEQKVLAIQAGMTGDEVTAILGPAQSTTQAEHGVQVCKWTRQSILWRVHATSESAFTERTASVEFAQGKVTAVVYENRSTH